jgi:hypothetical protein
MLDESELNEALSDANAYFFAGHVDAAVDLLLETLDECGPESAAAEPIYTRLGAISCALWEKKNFELNKAVTSRVMNEVLKRVGGRTDPEYLDIYVTACIETGSNPFPVRRLFRHQNLIAVFHKVPDDVPGDVVECGCARGLSFLELCLDHGNRHPGWLGEGFHVFDSFEGLSKPVDKDLDLGRSDAKAAHLAENMVAGRFAFSLELVSENVHRRFPNAQLHPGWIPSCFEAQPERTYRFVHIDVDLYQPTRDSLDYFHPRLAKGGIIITDDYIWPGARRAFREFCEEKGLKLHTTDTWQAFLVSPGNPVQRNQ